MSRTEPVDRSPVGTQLCCPLVFQLRARCNPDTALTLGALRACWAGLDNRTPILVTQSPTQAHWVQHGDVITASGLTVLRLLAPYAKQAQPAPGTPWVRANTLRCTTDYTNEPGA